MKKLLLSLSLYLMSFCTYAIHSTAISKRHGSKGSFGYIADNMLSPVEGLIHLTQVAVIMCGVGMVMGAMFKFSAWRRNPVEVTVGVPIVMMVTGLGLFLLGIIPYLPPG